MQMLRDYQEDLIEQVREAYRRGYRSPCIVLPCGGGKSVIVAEIAKRTTYNGNNVLFLIHRRELREQIISTFSRWGVDMSLCDVMMVQTAARRAEKLRVPSLVITDENHHCLASSYKTIYEEFPKAHFLGVTATPVRLNGDGLGDVNDVLINGVSAKWLIENNFLAPYDYYAPSVSDLTGIKISHGEYVASDIEKLLAKSTVFGDVIGCYKKLAKGKQAICYCASIRHSEEMAAAFRKAGIEAAHIDGSTPPAEREHIIEEFRRGAIDILCNVDLISEGFDVPDCECAILLRPTKSLTLFIQQSMRCMRYKPGKRAVIIDHVGNYARFGMPDDDRKWTLQDKQTDNYNFSQLMSLANAVKLPSGKNYASVEELCRDFVGKCCNVEIEHKESNGQTRERVKFCNQTSFPECKHVFRTADSSQQANDTYKQPKQDAFAQPATAQQPVDLSDFEEINTDDIPF